MLFVSGEVVEGQIDAYLGPTVGLIMRAAIFVDWFDWLVGCVSELKLKLKMQVLFGEKISVFVVVIDGDEQNY